MGYCIAQVSNQNFLIKKKNFAKALKAIKALAGSGTIRDSGGRHYSWVTDSNYLNAKTLKDAALAWRWDLEIDDKGDAIGIHFDGEKMGDDEIFFKAIAPFVESGEIEMESREGDGARWKWVFRNKKFLEVSGRVVYDG